MLVTTADYRWAADLCAAIVTEENGLEKDVARQMGRLAMWQAAQRYDPEQGVTLRQYAKQRIRGAALDYIRAMSREPLQGVDGEEPSVESHENPATAKIDIHRLLGGLDERHEAVLRMRYLEGRSHVEIARELGVSEGRVSQIRTEALRAARR